MNKKKIVIFTGAGISEESGVPTFRDSNGLWENHSIEDVASLEGWEFNPELVLNFYNERRKNIQNCEPNEAHYNLVKLEEKYDVIIITQNVDDLHERAGSTNILHLHGSLLESRSESNVKLIQAQTSDIKYGDLARDGSQLRPNIVWFGEDVSNIHFAQKYVSEADYFIIIGTSLQVYPAAGLMDYTNNS